MKLDLNISDRDRRLIFVALIVGMLLLSFKFGYTNINAKADSVKVEVDALKEEYDRLYDMYVKEPEYKKKIVEFDAISDEIMTKYATNNTQEYMIMFLKSLESESNWISRYTIPASVSSSVIANDTKGSYVGHAGTVSATFSASYDAMLTFIKNLNYNDKKTGISSLSLTFNQQDGSVAGQASLDMYSVTGPDRTPEAVNTPSVLIGKKEAGLFKSDTFSPDMTTADMTTATKIRDDNDLYVLVNQWGSSLDNVVVGFSKDNTGKLNLAANGNEKHKVTITISGSNGEYKASYQLDSQSIESTAFVAGETIDILISSSTRPADIDLVTAEVSIKNNSDKTVNYTLINEDPAKKRVTMNNSGDVVPY